MISQRYKFSILTLLFLVFAGPILGQEQGEEQGFLGNYKILVDRNIFSRNRGRSFERESREAKEQVAPAPESYLVLKGIVQQGSERIAFLENSRTGETMRARIGDAVARGKVQNITLDTVEYELNGKLTKIEIGNNLEGSVSSPPLTYDDLIESTAMSSEIPTAATSSAGETQPDEDDDVLRRLRERRQNELEK